MASSGVDIEFFSTTTIQEIGSEERLRNDLLRAKWNVKFLLKVVDIERQEMRDNKAAVEENDKLFRSGTL